MNEYVEQVIRNPFIQKLLVAFLGVIIILTLRNIVRSRIGKYIKDRSSYYRTKKAIGWAGYFLIILFILFVYGNELSGITVFFGVAGAGIAFALQEVIVSIAGWIAILSTDIYKTGDRVQLGGIKGDVVDVGVLRTTIMEMGDWVDGDLYNGRMVRVANSFVFKEPVYNYSSDFPFLWDEIKVPIKYGSDYSLVRKILEETGEEVIADYTDEAAVYWDKMLKKFFLEEATVKPMVTMEANDNWVEFTLRYVVDYKSRRIMKDLLFQNILEKIEKRPEEISLASATFELVEMPRVKVVSEKDQEKK
ncbi:MAG TPA: transporter [Eubacteriaceae bacterium]|nr:transporter [Eubacteriaceae bacterium]